MSNKKESKLIENILHKIIVEGKTFQEAVSLTDSHLEEVYSLAYDYYNTGRLKEAVALFAFLVTVNSRSYKFQFGLAASSYKSGEYIEAAFRFGCAYSLETTNPLPAYYAAESLLKVNELEKALYFLDCVIETAGNRNEHDKIKERAKIIKKNIDIK